MRQCLWENNLYQFFRIVSPKIQFDLPKPFKLEKGWKRKDDTPIYKTGCEIMEIMGKE